MRNIILILILLSGIVCPGQEYYSETEKSNVTFQMYNVDSNQYGLVISRPSYVAISYENQWLYIHDCIENQDRWFEIIDKVNFEEIFLITAVDLNNEELCGIELKTENGHKVIEFVYAQQCKFKLSAPIDLCLIK